VPGWSPEIANEFIWRAAQDRQAFDQLQLQGLVYVAHGWSLALRGQPLTGDRPEAWEYGPMYRRLADALAHFGQAKVTEPIVGLSDALTGKTSAATLSDVDQSETDLIADIYQNYGNLESWQLSALTRKGNTPWKQVFRDGVGKGRDIPHHLIRAQFVELLRLSG